MKILIDTNFILSAIKFKIRLPGDILIPSSVLHELRIIAQRKSVTGARARAALMLLENKKIVNTHGNADKAILKYSIDNNCAVATNDKKLIKALKASGIKIIRIRQKKYIIEE